MGAVADAVASQRAATAYVAAEVRRQRRSFAVGVFTVFLVVFAVSLLLNSVLKAPLIFMRLAESSVGENDIVIAPGARIEGRAVEAAQGRYPAVGGVELALVNHTRLAEGMRGVGALKGAAPRWVAAGSLAASPGSLGVNATVAVLGLDLPLEADIGLGREWRREPLGGGEAYVSRSAVRQTGADPAAVEGANLTLSVDLLELALLAGVVDGGSTEGLGALVRAVSPELAAAWNDTVSVDVRDAVLNGTALGGVGAGGGAANATGEALDELERQLRGLLGVNITFPAAVRNATDVLEAAADFLRGLDANQTTVETTVGEVAEAAIEAALGGGGATVSQQVTVRGVVGSPDGKWPESFGNVVVLDADWLWSAATGALLDVADAVGGGALSLAGGVAEVPLPAALGGGTVSVDLPDGVGANLSLSFNATAFREAVEGLRKEDAAVLSVLQYRGRVSAYLSAVDSMWRSLVRFSDAAADAAGHDSPTWFEAPIAVQLNETVWVRYFLDNIFGSVAALIAMLGVLLIYSLLLSDVESRTYEYGMLRALGLRKGSLVQILVTKSMAFAALGIALGLLACLAANVPVEDLIASFAALPPDYSLTAAAVGAAVALGLVMPLVANVSPVRRALRRTLRDSLDVYHSTTSEVTITQVRLANLGLSAWQTTIAVLLVVVGFVVYYVVPYSFTFQRYDIFLAILNAILLGMLLGLCILSVGLQPLGERLAVRLMLGSGPHRHLRDVVRKNLAGHRPRNSKTALMFVISVAFVVFAGVMFQLQSRSITDNIRVFVGADLVGFAPSTDEALRETEIGDFLAGEVARRERGEAGAVVEAYTFVSFQMNDFPEVRRSSLSNLSEFPWGRQWLYSVQRNYLDVVYAEYYAPTDTAAGPGARRVSGHPDCIAAMYDDAQGARLPAEPADGAVRVPRNVASGRWREPSLAAAEANDMADAYGNYVDLVMSEAMRPHASVGIGTALDVRIDRVRPGTGERTSGHYLGKARGILKKLPGFFFSSYQITARFSSYIVPEHHFVRLLNTARAYAGLGGVERAPKQKVMVRVSAGASEKERSDVLNGIRAHFVSDKSFGIDARSVVESTRVAFDLLGVFFTVVSALAMVMCFFILWISFVSNVNANGFEIGVLRSLGLTSFQCQMAYVYEALAVVLTSLALGSAIGIAIAVTLQVQFNLFVELPFKFSFPHLLYWTMAAMSVSVAVLGSLLPARAFLRRNVADILRRV